MGFLLKLLCDHHVIRDETPGSHSRYELIVVGVHFLLN